MKKIIITITLLSVMLLISCFNNDIKKVQNIPTIVKEGFLNSNEYEIVCIGFPKEGLAGIQKDESAKRAAILNAYYYAGTRFDDTVKPDTDGKVTKFVISEEYATVYYVISKSNLKSRIKK